MYGIPAISQKDSTAERGLQRLAGAVLIQAMQDASSGPRRAKEEAIDWLQGGGSSKFSFEFCCSLLGRDPNDVLMRLRRFAFMPQQDGSSYDSRSYFAA
ncbi:MAG: hypothetical protein O2968_02095 [Acidobacteria bacterium]|nr:hypothetical protein [Acidobacteriota bacterium]